MPVVVLQPSGRTTLHSSQQGPNSHLCLAVVTLIVCPPFGLVALIFSIWSRMSANMDWDGARRKGKVSMFLSVTGIAISLTFGLIFILVFYSKDNRTA